MKILYSSLLVFALTMSCGAQHHAVNGNNHGIVQILTTFQEYSSFAPWQKRDPGLRIGYGVAISETEVLTTENLVRNSTLVELRRTGSGEKIQATVVLSDEQANLALLKISDPGSATKFVPIPVMDSLSRTGDVSILQFDETTQIQKGKAQIVQVSVKSLPTAPYPALAFTLLTELNINGEGAVAVRDGKLAGLIMSYDRGTRTGNMLPCVTIKHFLEDARQLPYKGFPSAWFLYMPLIDPAKRKYHKANDENNGILVLKCLPSAGTTESLMPNDVILEWDKYQIDNLGFYEDPDFGRLAFFYLIMGRRSPGDMVPAKIIRNGQETNITVQLTRRTDRESLVPENVTHEREEYLVEGGFVIRELSANYLLSYGSDWQKYVDPRLVNIYLTKRLSPEKPGDRVVILASVLPDPINIGYQNLRNQIITRINDKPVRNMTDVFKIVKEDGHVQRVSLQSSDVELVLDQATLGDANTNLARQYRIPRLRYQRGSSK